MINKNFLILASLSTLLVTTALGAEKDVCVGGVCVVNLDNLQSSRSFTPKKQKIEENFQSNEIDNFSPIIFDGELMSVSPFSEMKDAKTFPLEDEIVIVEDIQKIEDIILERTGLPASTYYCENNKIPLFDKYVDIYECV